MELNPIPCLNGQIGVDVLFLVVKAPKLGRDRVREMIVVKSWKRD